VCPCGATTWRNPTPVAVLLVPVRDGGVLLVRRNIPPAGKLALPGGFVDFGETWQAAAAREVREEAGIAIDVAGVRHLRTVSPPDGGVVLVFGAAAPIDGIGDGWQPNPEVIERLVVTAAVELAFPTHTDVLRAWFAGELEKR
jgi:ADP-ribose pyrophosphatase YjhB (NUDIX family)